MDRCSRVRRLLCPIKPKNAQCHSLGRRGSGKARSGAVDRDSDPDAGLDDHGSQIDGIRRRNVMLTTWTAANMLEFPKIGGDSRAGADVSAAVASLSVSCDDLPSGLEATAVGLLPPCETSSDLQFERIMAILRSTVQPLDKYRLLMTLKRLNVDAYYYLLASFPAELIPIIYTPTIGEACLSFGLLLVRPTGLYISYSRHKGKVNDLLQTWPSSDIRIVVVTDGERVLGLGDLGVHGMGIVTGKSDIYCAYGAVTPQSILPVSLDVGCTNAAFRKDVFYLGARSDRLRGDMYTAFVDEFMAAVASKFGPSTVVHFEDFGRSNALALLDRYQSRSYNVFNDDIEATSCVTLAALVGSTLQRGVPPLERQRFLFFGAGQAGIGIANLLSFALRRKGMSDKEARDRIWLFDSKGLVTLGRSNIPQSKARYAKPGEYSSKSLQESIRSIRPTTLIGAASVPRAFNQSVIRSMAESNDRPVIFSLSNPSQRAECSATDATEWSSGAAVFASGTPDPTAKASTVNNALVFPAIGKGLTLSPGITDEKLLSVSLELSSMLTSREIRRGQVLPDVSRLGSIQSKLIDAFCGHTDSTKGRPWMKYDPHKCYEECSRHYSDGLV